MPKNDFGFDLPIAQPTPASPYTVAPLASPFAAGIEGDVSAALPPEPKRRFLLLQDAVSDANAIQSGLSARLIDVTEAMQKSRRRLAEIKGQRGVDESHPEFIAQTAALANAEEELARLNVRIAAHEAIAGPRRQLLEKITTWLRSTAAGFDLREVELIPVPKLAAKENEEQAVSRLRRRLRELSSEARRIEASPFPSAFAKQLAAAHVDRLAEAAAPYVGHLVEHGGALIVDNQQVEEMIVWPVKQTSSKVDTVAGTGVAISETIDVVGLLCWLHRDQMVKRIGDAIDEESDDGAALTHAQRAEQLAVIAGDREAVEREEAFWVWQAYAAGNIVEPRPDADAAAFLGVAVGGAAARPKRFDHADAFAVARRAVDAAGGEPTSPGTPS